jgi:hypothetical protein
VVSFGLQGYNEPCSKIDNYVCEQNMICTNARGDACKNNPSFITECGCCYKNEIWSGEGCNKNERKIVVDKQNDVIDKENIRVNENISSQIRVQCSFNYECLKQNINNDSFCNAFLGECVKNSCQIDPDCPFGYLCNQNECVKPQLSIVFIPLSNISKSKKDTFLKKQESVFEKSFLLNNCSSKSIYTVLPYKRIDNLSSYTMESFPIVIDKNYPELSYYKKLILVGIIEGKESNGGGMSIKDINTVFIITNTEDYVLAHEIGHIYGLKDQYCYNPENNTRCYMGYCGPNYLRKELGGGEFTIKIGIQNGVRTVMDFFVKIFDKHFTNYCEQNFSYPDFATANKNIKGGRSVMGYNSDGKYYFDKYEYAFFEQFESLRCEK